jgi:hypothetical protein
MNGIGIINFKKSIADEPGVTLDAILKRPLAAVVLLFNKVIPGSESDEMGIVRRSRNGDGTGTTNVGVT